MMCIPLGGNAIRLSNTKHHTKEESAKTLQLPFIAVHHAKVPFKESLYSTAIFAMPPGSSNKTKSYLNEWGNPEISVVLNSQLNYIFQIRNKSVFF